MAFAREYTLNYTYLGLCPGAPETVSVIVSGRTESTITGLVGDSLYAVTLVAVNDRGNSGVAMLNVTTLARGERRGDGGREGGSKRREG